MSTCIDNKYILTFKSIMYTVVLYTIHTGSVNV